MLLLLACGTPGSTTAPVASSSVVDSAAPPAASPGVPPSPATDSPPIERSCTRDEDCAVARIEASGPQLCCPMCGTVAGTKRWHAALKLFCGDRSVMSCPAMDCPVEPRRAVCKSGQCDSEPTTDSTLFDAYRCLPAMQCDGWYGCAGVMGNKQDGWFAHQADKAKRGEIVSIEQVCTKTDTKCEAARVHSVGIQCPPRTVPPLIEPPPYTCAEKDGRCVATPR